MKANEERWGDFTLEETQKCGFLALPNSVMEHICRYLDNIGDKYQACFIHPQWTTAAQNVLWEKPRFEKPTNFRLFLKNIQETKKTALLVRDVYLVFIDHEETLFQTIVKSTMKRHEPHSNVLSNPNFMSRITRTCEKLNTLTVYGWNMETSHIDGLASTAHNLTSLHIIGAKLNDQLSFNNLYSRLTRLCLDGVFNLDEKWASSLINKANHLTELQISLKNMELDVLVKICTPHKLALTDLTFTDAKHMSNEYVKHALSAFPLLTRFCLEGSIGVTALSIFYAIKSCPKLNSIEIRAHPDSLLQEFENDNLNSIPYSSSFAQPCRLLIENLNIDNDQLVAISPYFNLLQTLGFKNCPLITSYGIEQAFQNNRFIKVFQSINCSNIDSDLLIAFSTMEGISKSLYQIHIESSGSILPKDIYQFCCSCAEYNLRQIRLVGYESLQHQSIIGSYNHPSPYRDDRNTLSVLTLDRTAIDALINSTDPELCSLPEDRFITGNALVRLADHFKIDVNDLLDLLDRFELEPNHRKSISFELPSNTVGDKPANRVFALKSQATNYRSTTPAIWSQDLDNEMTDRYHDDDTHHLNEDATDDSQQATTTDDEEEEYETSSHLTQTYTTVPNNTGSEINSALGGWGVGITEQWNTTPKQHQVNTTTPSPQKERKSRTHSWNAYTEDKFINQWQQNSLAVNQTKPTPNRPTKHYRNSPVITETDGWGSPDKYVPWQNVEDQGFAKELIEEQQKTSYWNGENYINSSSAQHLPAPDYENETLVMESSGTTTPASPAMLFSDLTNNATHTSTKRHSNTNDVKFRPRSQSLISSDGSVSWNESSNESIIKVSVNNNNKVANTTKKSKNEPISRWASAEEWNALKHATSDVNPSSTTKAKGWQKDFSPEVIADKNAKNEWTSLSGNATHTSRRTTFSRPARKAREPIPPATMSGNWADYTNSPSHTTHSPPTANTRTTQPSPSRSPINKNQSAVLIDTENVASMIMQPNHKGDVWESISSLDITPTSNVLNPQVAHPNQDVRAEIMDWNTNDTPILPKKEAHANTLNAFHFTETIPGTVTQAEIKAKEQQQSNDNLVDFEVFIPTVPISPKPTSMPDYSLLDSSKIASPSVGSSSVGYPKATSPSVGSPNVGSPNVASPKVASPKVASPKVASPKVTSPKVTSPKVTSPKVASPKVASPNVASPNVASPNVASPKVASPKVASPKVASPKVASPAWGRPQNNNASVLDELDFTSIVSSEVYAAVKNQVDTPSSSPILNQNNLATHTESSNILVASTQADGNGIESSEERYIKPAKLKIPINGKFEFLCVHNDEDINEVVTKFCMQHNKPEIIKDLVGCVSKKRTELQTKAILNRNGKRIKKTSSIS